MTEEERAEAKSYADKHAVTFERIPLWNRLFNAYAAACESKRAEIERLQKIQQDDERDKYAWLEAERARSAKLIEHLAMIKDWTGDSELINRVDEWIEEYEAGRGN